MLDITACIDRPPVPLDGDVDVDGLFDGFKLCIEGGTGMLDEDPVVSIPDGTGYGIRLIESNTNSIP